MEAAGDAVEPIPDDLLAAKRAWLIRCRRFGGAEFDRLVELLSSADEVVTTRDAFRRSERPHRFIAHRHDMDHDIENSLRFARREAEHGFRSSYFVLHTDWYYRGGHNDRLSTLMLTALQEIESLGHEIGLHNNAVTAGLLTGEDPVRILERELNLLRSHGFDVTGTVAHGDRLCHECSYVNSELFVEHPRPALGKPDREIVREGAEDRPEARVRLRPVPMAELGLEYEAGFIGHEVYLSDSGGRWNWPLEDVRNHLVEQSGFLQILTHPVWWAFEDENVSAREPRNDALRIAGKPWRRAEDA